MALHRVGAAAFAERIADPAARREVFCELTRVLFVPDRHRSCERLSRARVHRCATDRLRGHHSRHESSRRGSYGARKPPRAGLPFCDVWPAVLDSVADERWREAISQTAGPWKRAYALEPPPDEERAIDLLSRGVAGELTDLDARSHCPVCDESSSPPCGARRAYWSTRCVKIASVQGERCSTWRRSARACRRAASDSNRVRGRLRLSLAPSGLVLYARLRLLRESAAR
jgi:hypothetical protein